MGDARLRSLSYCLPMLLRVTFPLAGAHFVNQAARTVMAIVGPVLAVRPYCHTDHYWQVYFDSNRMIREALAEAGFPAPMPAQNVIVSQSA